MVEFGYVKSIDEVVDLIMGGIKTKVPFEFKFGTVTKGNKKRGVMILFTKKDMVDKAKNIATGILSDKMLF